MVKAQRKGESTEISIISTPIIRQRPQRNQLSRTSEILYGIVHLSKEKVKETYLPYHMEYAGSLGPNVDKMSRGTSNKVSKESDDGSMKCT
jgi:hypothetical protein